MFVEATATYHYDNAGRVEEVVNFNGSRVLYGYDDANRLTSIQNLTSENAIISSQSFVLDGNGNRIQEERTGPVKSAVKLASLPATYIKNRLDTVGGQAVGHDDEGQRASKGGDSYTFDPRHRLTSVAGSGSTIYLYDGASNRIQVDRDGIVKKYIYDIKGNLIAEADENNTITRYYYYGAGLLGFDDLTGVNGATNYSYHFDALGSTIAISDNTEQLVNRYSYSPFGVILQDTEFIQQPFKYVGQLGVVAEENGLYYMRARYYDPQVGRFISEDPIGFDGGDVNLYVYGANNPVLYVDPNGEAIFTSTAAVTMYVLTPVIVRASPYIYRGGRAAGQALIKAGEYAVTTAYLATHGAIAAWRAGMNFARTNPKVVEPVINFTEGFLGPYSPALTTSGVIGNVTSEYGSDAIQTILNGGSNGNGKCTR